MSLSNVISSLSSDPSLSSAGGAELVAADGRTFAFQGATLTGQACGGIARLVLEQHFKNPYKETVAITYRMPVPAEGAVSAYSFEVGDRRIHGEIDTKHKARERFTQAVAKGHTAALLEESRGNIFTQEIGNVPPETDLKVRIVVEQRLDWTPEGGWELRFPTVIGPRYLSPRDTAQDARDVSIQVASSELPFRIAMEIDIEDTISEGGRITSPSHTVAVSGTSVKLGATAGARLDRDIVLRWPVAARSVGASCAVARPSVSEPHAAYAYALVTVVPPAPTERARPVARDLIVLLDTSGSMSGSPLAQAKRAVCALVDSLGPQDRFEIIEFSNAPRRYKEAPLAAQPEAKRAAIAWVQKLEAGGATEMYTAIQDALSALRLNAQRQVLLVTDGYIGGEAQIIQLLHERFPKSCRLHVLGVGSAVNRSLSGPLARAGRGVEVLIGLDEDVEKGIDALCRRMNAPILTDVSVEGPALLEHAPAMLPDVFQGAPLLVAAKVSPAGGTLRVRGTTAQGAWETEVRVPATAAGQGSPAVVSLFARECVADLETRWAIGADVGRIDKDIERIGLVFKIATRLTSFVAVDETVVHDGESARHDVVPQELPYGTLMEGFGFGGGGVDLLAATASRSAAILPRSAPLPASFAAPPPPAAPAKPMGAPLPAAPVVMRSPQPMEKKKEAAREEQAPITTRARAESLEDRDDEGGVTNAPELDAPAPVAAPPPQQASSGGGKDVAPPLGAAPSMPAAAAPEPLREAAARPAAKAKRRWLVLFALAFLAFLVGLVVYLLRR